MDISSRSRRFFFNGSALLSFELIFHCILLSAVVPLYRAMQRFALTRLDVPVLGFRDLSLLLSHPDALALSLGALLILLFFLYWDLAALVFFCAKRQEGQRLTLWQLGKNSFFTALRGLRGFRALLLLLLPALFFSVCPLSIRFSQSLRIPTLFLDWILAFPLPLWAEIALPVVALLVLLLYAYGLPAVLLEGQGYFTSWRTSVSLLVRHPLKTLGHLASAFALWLGCAVALTAGALALLVGLLHLLYEPDEARYLFRSALHGGGAAWGLALLLLLVLFLSNGLVVLLRRDRGQSFSPPAAVPLLRMERLRSALSLVCAVVVLVFMSESGLADHVLSPALPLTSTIVAHRGASAVAPENTLAALEAAIAMQANMAEIDIRQTRDGAFVVIHDATGKRVAGQPVAVEDTLLREIETWDAGTHFSPAFAGEKVPTLREVLACAKDRITLMIEVKGVRSGSEGHMLRLIQDYDMADQCIIASMDLEVLRQVKDLLPAVQTVYIASQLTPEEYALDYVDGYSVRLSAVSRELAIRFRAQGKPIYSWTPNTLIDVRRLLLCDVDGIVTDDVVLAQRCLAWQGVSPLPDLLTRWFFPTEDVL